MCPENTTPAHLRPEYSGSGSLLAYSVHVGVELETSVIIPCYRADDSLPLQLEALSRQVGAPPFEVLLVDNGENRCLQLLAARARDAGLAVRVVNAIRVKGVGYARNVGIGAARAEKLLFCDADDVVMPEWVRNGSNQLDRGPVFSGGAVPVSEALCSMGWATVVAHVGPHPDSISDLAASGDVAYPILMGGSFGITRDLALRLGGFDLAFGNAAEDNDLAFRIVRAGLTLPDAGHVCIAYRIRGGSATFSRGFRSGWAHAFLCARHSAWGQSPAFRGRWVLRPARTSARLVLKTMDGKDTGEEMDRLGRELGTIVGRLCIRSSGFRPPALGVGIAEGELLRNTSQESGTPVEVSVVMPCYNVEHTVVRQLVALTTQEGAPRFEVVVVLNGCTDHSAEVIGEFAVQHPELNLRIVSSPKGRARARNRGVEVARGEIVAFCDADDVVFPDWLRHLAERVQTVHGLVGGSLVHRGVNPPELLRVYGLDPEERDPAELPDLPPDDLSKLREVAEGNFAAWRADYLAVGGMDASFEGGLEGTDLCLRAQLQGVPVNSCRAARVAYVLRDTSRGTFAQQRALARAKLLFFVRHFHTGRSAGASAKFSLLGLARSAAALAGAWRLEARERQALMHELGGHLGSVEGHLLYRVLCRVPEPELMTPVHQETS